MPKIVLHVGCGHREAGKIHQLFASDNWKEIRFDIDPSVDPDIVGSITQMDAVSDNSMDAVYSAHNLEHLYFHEVDVCLREFLRVLKPQGFALIGVPNLQKVAALIARDEMDVPAYTSPAGEIFPVDMVYGFRPAIQAGNIHMAHKTGFTPESLVKAVMGAGFSWAQYDEDTDFGLWIKGYKTMPPQEIADQPLW